MIKTKALLHLSESVGWLSSNRNRGREDCSHVSNESFYLRIHILHFVERNEREKYS